MTIIKLDITTCSECPKNKTRLTKGFGYATDNMCSLKGDRVTSEYIEWDSDLKLVPYWCPLREN